MLTAVEVVPLRVQIGLAGAGAVSALELLGSAMMAPPHDDSKRTGNWSRLHEFQRAKFSRSETLRDSALAL